ncbi:MAG: chromosome segregation protein SMC [Deltaproteobacteria bacterium]|nr:chromosome segregation protein SMC [Deltaproteobacteria bacterium]
MYLKKIVINGFKSFADRVVISFQKSHISGVVGPNGSGKSNIIDAVRWVMGEQNTKMLRGEKATDIIFAGSEKRKSQGMAEVSLVFDNSENSPFCPVEYRSEEEITVTRRLYSDGSREYLINQKACRFKDILDFFISSSLGSKSYSMIQQGQVDRILQAKPEEIREIIEEAAGTIVFKLRSQETEKKLETTRANLARIDDLALEVDRHMAGLQEQVERSQEWQTLQETVRSSEMTLWALRHREFKDKEESFTQKIAEESTRDVKNLADLSRFEAQHTEMLQELEESDPEIKKLNEEVTLIREKLARTEESLSHAFKLIANGDQQISQIEEELTKENSVVHNLETLAAKQNKELSLAKAEQGSCEASIEEFRYQAALYEEKEQVLSNKLADLREETRNIDRMIDTNHGRIELIKKNLQKANHEKNEQIKKLIQLEDQHSQDLIVVDSAKLKVERARRDMNECLDEKNALDASLEAQRNALQEHDGKIGELKEELLAKRAEFLSLEELIKSSSTVKSICEELKADNPDRSFKLLIDLVAFNERISSIPKAAALAFEKWAERFVFSSREELNGFLKLAKKRSLNRIPASLLEVKADALSDWLEKSDGTPFSELLTLEGGDEALEMFLRHVVFLPTHEITEQVLQGARRGAVLITEDGTVISAPGEMQIGKTASGLLTYKSKMLSLESSLGSQQKKLEALQAKRLQTAQKLDSLQTDQKRLQEESFEKNRKMLEAASDLKTIESQLSHKEELILAVRELTRGVEETCEKLETELGDLQGANVTLLKEKKETESEIKSIRESIDELKEEKEEQSETFQQQKIKLASLRERSQSLESSITQLEDQVATHRTKFDGKRKSLANLQENIAAARDNRSKLESDVTRLIREREEKDILLTEKQKNCSVTREQLKEVESKLKICRDLQNRNKKAISETELEAEKTRLAAQALQDQAHEKYQFDLGSVDVPKNVNPGTLGNRIKNAREKLESFGPINMRASQEYSELKERKDFVDKQKEEVLSSMDILAKAKQEIEENARTKFMSTFDALNKEFRELFPILFPGGEGHIALTEPENPLTSGAEIMVRLPGKKTQAMRLFSGGEKALTAISLIFALLKSNPAPFCFLDEVDAPLDEANVKRFNRVLEVLSTKFQFIVITHNRRTMEVFDTLYGVTMQEPGVSKLVGVDLSQALPPHLQKAFGRERSIEGASAS